MNTDKSENRLYNSNRITSWSSLWAELFQSKLIAPKDIDPRDIQFERRLVLYRLMLVLMAFALVAVIAETILSSGISLVTLVAGVSLIAIVATSIGLYIRQFALLPPVIALVITFTAVLMAVADGAEHNRLLLFPLMIALAGLLPTSVALVLGTTAIAVLLIIGRGAIGSTEIAVYFALVATWLLSLAVMRLVAQQADELADLALTDPLTGAFNRRYLLPQAERNLADYRRYTRLSTLIMIDIDHFKAVNDRFGHDVGDFVLKALVRLVDDRIRGVDMLYRLGGEEFVVMLTEVGAASATKVAEELRVTLSELNVLPSGHFTVSLGICDVTSVTSGEEWLRKVDEALYSAKAAGRNRIAVVASEPPAEAHVSNILPTWR